MARLPKVPDGWLNAGSGQADSDFASGDDDGAAASGSVPDKSIGSVQGDDLVGGIPFEQHYADSILNRVRDSYGGSEP